MKKFIACLVPTLLLVALTTGVAFGQIYCDDQDLVALVFANQDINHTIAPGTFFTVELMLLNPSSSCVGAFELGIQLPDGLSIMNVEFPVEAINIGNPTNLIVGYGSPRPIFFNQIELATLTLVSSEAGVQDIFLSPAEPASIEGQMTIVGCPEEMVPVFPISGQFDLPVARINPDEPLNYCEGQGLDGITVGISCQGDTDNIAGSSSWATDGYDQGLDLPDEATEPVVSFLRPQWGAPVGDVFRQDVRATFFPTTETRQWPFHVDASIPAGETAPYEVTITFDPSYAGNELIHTSLVDHTAYESVLLEAPFTYTYLIEGDDSREFTLYVGNESAVLPEGDLVVLVDAIGPYHADLGNLAATAEGATDGWDSGLDLPEPGPPPGDYLTVSFWQNGWPYGPRYRSMVNAPFNPLQEYRSWPLRVETDETGTLSLGFTPNFDQSSGIPFYLMDPATGELFNLWPDLTHTFHVGNMIARDYELIVGTLSVPPLTPAYRTIEQGWNLIALPLVPDPAHDSLQETVLDNYAGHAYIYRYLGEDGYQQASPVEEAVHGQGYWLGVSSDYSWAMEGDMATESVVLPLTPGWNLVGYPLWFPGDLENLDVEYQGQTMPWSGAVEGGLVSGSMIGFHTASASYYTTSSFSAYQAYWVSSLVEGVNLVFDYSEFIEYRQDGEEPLDPPRGAWSTTLTARGRDGVGHDVTCGAHPDASAGFDPALDMPLAPRAPFATAQLGIRRAEWDLPCGNLMMEDRTGTLDDAYSWTLEYLTNDPGPITLQWRTMDWPADLEMQVYLPAENRVVLDDMRTQSSLRLDASTGFLQVVIRTPRLSGAAEIPLRSGGLAVHPNPFNPQTTIAFNLERSGDADVRIYSVRGELVEILRQDGLAAGRHEMVWQGRDRDGRDVPSGSYFARLYLDGGAVGAVVKMSLVR